MKTTRQKGFSTALMSLAVLAGALSAFTVVEFNDFLAKARIAEALHVADEARFRVNEFYLLSDRFPSTESEVEALTRDIDIRSDRIHDVVFERSYAGHDVALKIYLDAPKNGDADASPFVFVAGKVSDRGRRGIDWSCGARGVDPDRLPGRCPAVDG